VIIGGGIIGASVAYNLASAYSLKNVIVVEKSRLGSGSTSASLGGFRHQFSSELGIRLTMESLSILDEFERTFKYDPLIRRDGYCFIASKEETLRALRKNGRLARGLGIDIQFLENSELERRFPFYSFKNIMGGNFSAEDGHASTSSVFQGYVSKSKILGAKFYENTEAKKILVDGDNSVRGVGTTDGTIDSSKVLIAAGAFSGTVGKMASVNIPIKPYPRKILVTNTLSENIPDRIPLIVDVDSTLAIGREGKGIIFADNEPTESSFELTFPPDYDERVMSKAIKRVPALSNASISYSDMGLYEMTPDANPIVSEISQVKGLYCCAGFAGHGFMHAPAIGRLMAEILMDEKTHLDLSSYDIRRFEAGEGDLAERLII
jgi:glycine/D-amino acid oxidase-like deaminating enzyme